MGRKASRPTLCVRRVYAGQREMLSVFADAYRVYFEDMEKAKSSDDTFDLGGVIKYNEDDITHREEKSDGTAA